MQFRHTLRQICLSLTKDTYFESIARNTLQLLVSPKGTRYDRLTRIIIQQTCRTNSNCVDIGAYRGEILKTFLRHCPEGKIFAFEPIPENISFLKKKFADAYIFDIALSTSTGTAEFFVPTGRPARSGLTRHHYPNPKEVVEIIQVNIDLLDNVINDDTPIDFIKIDVEGSEFEVLTGAKRIIQRHKPVLVFEHGPFLDDSAVERSWQLYNLINVEFDYSIFPLRYWDNRSMSLSQQQFLSNVSEHRDYYFVAYSNK